MGPEISMVAARYSSRFSRHLQASLDVWDGRRVAEYIVDKLLTDEAFVEGIGTALPNIRRIFEQNAVSHCVPELDPLYAGRTEEEKQIIQHLKLNPHIVVWGMGGIGKTELVCAVAHALRSAFEMIVWVDAEGVARVQNLMAIDIRRNGERLNLFGLLRTHRTLVVLDNIGSDIKLIELVPALGNGSRVLVTSQVAFGDAQMELSLVDRERARAILSKNVSTPCPEEVLDAVYGAVGGHPLVLRIMNQHLQQGFSWEETRRDCQFASGFADDKRSTVAQRILERHLNVLGPELAFLVWSGSPAIDAGLLKAAIGLTGIDKLRRWALLARSQSDTVRLHDLVFASASHLKSALPIDAKQFESRLERYLEETILPKSLPFFRVVNRHRDLVRKALEAAPRPGILRYAYLHGYKPVELEPALIGDPMSDASVVPVDKRQRAIWILSLVETIEADYRRVRDLGDKSGARKILEERLAVFDRLLADIRLSEEEKAIARHHRAKSLLKLGQAASARNEFEEILKDGKPHPATRLQLARLCEDDSERAKNLIFDIIDQERAEPNTVATSTIMETLATMRRRHLRKHVREMTARYGQFMALQIKAAACSGEEHPFEAFAAVGGEWSYTSPDLFMDVFEQIELPRPHDAENDDELLAYGRIVSSAGKLLVRQHREEEARQCWDQAQSFYDTMKQPNAFARVQIADNLLLLKRPSEAATLLDGVDPVQREVFWHFRRAQTYKDLGLANEALTCINVAIEGQKSADYGSTFLALRSEVRRALGDPDCSDDLKSAIVMTPDANYRKELEARLIVYARE